jgi:hypothetical protein
MDPQDFHPPPEDVTRDRLRIETSPEELNAEAEALAKQIKEKAAEAASTAFHGRVQVSLTPRGRIRKNGPCPCGSGAKFKKCCLRDVKDPENEKKLPPPAAIRRQLKGRK